MSDELEGPANPMRLITNVVQAYERGYARGRRDGIREVCKYLSVDIPDHLCDELEKLDAVSNMGGDQTPQGSDPHE
jgi:hypothetical protein